MKNVYIFLIVTLFAFSTNAQYNKNFSDKAISNFSYSESQNSSLQMHFTINNISIYNSTDEFINIESSNFAKSLKKGEPNLPFLSKTIYLPLNVNPTLEVLSFDSEIINLKKKGFSELIQPSAGSISKSQEKVALNKIEKSLAYSRNEYINNQVVSLKFKGILRNIQVYELLYQPIAYNPVKNKINVKSNLRIEILLENSNDIPSNWKFGFEENSSLSQIVSLFNGSGKSLTKPTFLIVSPLKYKKTLQSFIQWKRQLGYYVSEAYIDEDITDNSKETIKSYIKSYYENPDKGTQAVSYLALIGDVVDIPAWNGTNGIGGGSDNHVTDLFYAEFTNDFLPELYYGRISVTDTSQLQNIIDKSLHTEKAINLPNDYQNNHLLVSGVDPSYASTYGNGAINYFTKYYSNTDQNINAKYYLYGSGSPIVSNNSQAKQSIINDFNTGVGVAYYTAHCSPKGWFNPKFQTADIASLTNKKMYPLMIGNCCQSVQFDLNSFGEDIVRAKDKGAAVYIGASDESLWDEDYYWGVGVTNIINANPTYEETGLGNWDAWFHLNSETIENQVSTVGQMLMIGNLAVQESNSTSKNYYWEIYHIIGDPTFVPAKYKMNKITAEWQQTLVINETNLKVNTISGAYVSLAENGIIIGGDYADETGLASVDFNALKNIGEKQVEIIVSHKDFEPKIDSINVIPTYGPYLVLLKTEIDDSNGNDNGELEHDEIVYLNVGFQNFGNDNAQQVKVNITTESEWVKSFILNSNIDYGEISSNQSKYSDLKFLLELIPGAPNNEEISFSGSATCDGTITFEFNFVITINSSNLLLDNFIADADGSGNNNGILEASEEATIQVYFINQGFAQVSNTVIEFSSRNQEILTVNNEILAYGGFDIGEKKAMPLEVTISDNIFNGAQAIIDYIIKTGENHQFISNGRFKVPVGVEPVIIMDTDTVVKLGDGLFYDSGGADNDYSNNENTTVTFKPYYSSQGVSIDFEKFDIASKANGDCWDYLEIYNGLNVKSPLLGSFCTTNYKKVVHSQNQDGALTFRFLSNASSTRFGWKARIESSERRNVKIVVSNGVGKIEDVSITLLDSTILTNADGLALFVNILEEGNKGFIIEKEGYYKIIDILGNIEGDTIINVLLEKLPEVCITVREGTSAIENARVLFNSETKYTNSNGQVYYPNQTEGTSFFTISAKEYNDTSGYITVPRYDMCYFIPLSKKKFYNLKLVVSDELGYVNSAKVIINGITKYTNDRGLAIYDSLYSENYSLVIEKENYKNYKSDISIPDSNSIKKIELLPIVYSAIFNVFHGEDRVSGAKILVKDMELVTSKGGQVAANDLRIENNIKFTIEHDKYTKYNGSFDIIDKNIKLDIQIFAIGISDKIERNIFVYPNPIGNNKLINIQSDANITRAEIYNIDGKKVKFLNGDSKNMQIDMTGLSKGIYTISVSTENGKYHKKVVLP